MTFTHAGHADLPVAPSRLRLILVLGALIAIGPLSIDMYLPALPRIAQDLHATDTAIQLTLTGTLVGLGLASCWSARCPTRSVGAAR